jgi:hypothetical protein
MRRAGDIGRMGERNLKGTRHLGDLGVYVRIILRGIIGKYGVTVWSALV